MYATTRTERDVRWRKSTYSNGGNDAQCIELACPAGDVVLVRDSKNPDGARLRFPLRHFRQALSAGLITP